MRLAGLLLLLAGIVYVSASPAQVATSLGSGSFKCNSAGTANITATASSGISGTATLHCNPVGTSSLLAGCTVSATKTVQNCTGTFPPAGWSLMLAQGFEGSNPLSANETTVDTINCTIAHSGSCSLDGFCQAFNGGFESCDVGGGDTINVAALGCCTNGDYYLSYWRRLSSTASNGGGNLDMSYASFIGNSVRQEEFLDCEYYSTTPSQSCNLGLEPEVLNGPSIDCNVTPNDSATGQTCFYVGNLFNWPIGNWEQDEFYFHAGTCTGGVPNNDGFYNMYINGTLVLQVNSTTFPGPNSNNPGNGGNLNGCLDMSAGQSIRAAGFADFQNPNPAFHIYADDIIVLKR